MLLAAMEQTLVPWKRTPCFALLRYGALEGKLFFGLRRRRIDDTPLIIGHVWKAGHGRGFHQNSKVRAVYCGLWILLQPTSQKGIIAS